MHTQTHDHTPTHGAISGAKTDISLLLTSFPIRRGAVSPPLSHCQAVKRRQRKMDRQDERKIKRGTKSARGKTAQTCCFLGFFFLTTSQRMTGATALRVFLGAALGRARALMFLMLRGDAAREQLAPQSRCTGQSHAGESWLCGSAALQRRQYRGASRRDGGPSARPTQMKTDSSNAKITAMVERSSCAVAIPRFTCSRAMAGECACTGLTVDFA